MVVLVDVDGVLANFGSSILTALGLQDQYCAADIKQFDIQKALNLQEDCYAQYGRLVDLHQLCLTMPPYEGARTFVQRLQSKHTVYACTSPLKEAESWLSQRSAWLNREVGIDLKHQIFCTDKSMVRGDILIDDKPEHCRNFAGANGAMLSRKLCSVLFAQPYNEPIDDFDRTLRECYNIARIDGYEPICTLLNC